LQQHGGFECFAACHLHFDVEWEQREFEQRQEHKKDENPIPVGTSRSQLLHSLPQQEMHM